MTRDQARAERDAIRVAMAAVARAYVAPVRMEPDEWEFLTVDQLKWQAIREQERQRHATALLVLDTHVHSLTRYIESDEPEDEDEG
jgi:hypothetical protein